MGGEELSACKPSQDGGEKAPNKAPLKELFCVSVAVSRMMISPKQRSVKVMNDQMSMKLADQMAWLSQSLPLLTLCQILYDCRL